MLSTRLFVFLRGEQYSFLKAHLKVDTQPKTFSWEYSAAHSPPDSICWWTLLNTAQYWAGPAASCFGRRGLSAAILHFPRGLQQTVQSIRSCSCDESTAGPGDSPAVPTLEHTRVPNLKNNLSVSVAEDGGQKAFTATAVPHFPNLQSKPFKLWKHAAWPLAHRTEASLVCNFSAPRLSPREPGRPSENRARW